MYLCLKRYWIQFKIFIYLIKQSEQVLHYWLVSPVDNAFCKFIEEAEIEPLDGVHGLIKYGNYYRHLGRVCPIKYCIGECNVKTSFISSWRQCHFIQTKWYWSREIGGLLCTKGKHDLFEMKFDKKPLGWENNNYLMMYIQMV